MHNGMNSINLLFHQFINHLSYIRINMAGFLNTNPTVNGKIYKLNLFKLESE